MDVKIIGNVGFIKGMLGNGILYVGQSGSGQYMIIGKNLVTVDGVSTEPFVYYRKSRVVAGYEAQEILLSNDFNLALITDVETPDFVTASADSFKVIPSVTNAEGLPRLWTFEPAYTLMGTGIVAADLAAVKTTVKVPVGTGTGLKTAAEIAAEAAAAAAAPKTGLAGIFPSDFSTLLTNPIKFGQDNAMFVALVVLVIYYFRRKQKKPLWIF